MTKALMKYQSTFFFDMNLSMFVFFYVVAQISVLVIFFIEIISLLKNHTFGLFQNSPQSFVMLYTFLGMLPYFLLILSTITHQ